MFYISDSLAFNLIVEGAPKPMDQGNLVSVDLVENVTMVVPILRLELKDVTGNFSSTPLLDGTRLFVQLGKHENGPPLAIMPFRVIRMPQATGGAQGQSVKVYCAYDSPQYIHGLVRKPYKGTVSEVFQQMVSDLGLNGFSGVETNDSQWWRPAHERYSTFARKLVKHAYVDNSSCLIHAHSAAGILFLRNLATAFEGKPKVKLTEKGTPSTFNKSPVSVDSPPTLNIISASIDSHTGMLNARGGYGSTVYQEMLSGQGDVFTDISAQRQSNVFGINSDVKDILADGVRARPAPIDCGNTHPNYIRAAHQNERRKALFSTFADVVIDSYTDLDLFDLVSLELIDRVTLGILPAYSQNWIIAARTRRIQGTKYYEALRLMATGTADDPMGNCL